MSWFPDVLGAVNNIVVQIMGLPQMLMYQFMMVIQALLYPVTYIFYLAQLIYISLYNIFVPIINLLISIANLPILVINMFQAVPEPWTVILFISLTISITIRAYKWVKEIRGWIPTMSGDNS